ncbi:hypothetical protein [Rhizobium sp. MHM7A]|uniref:hypothetical protein n=1 Tax=Rhizobium sp. MHM7A TaxID=2583233 RepID=UPI001105AA50|nr:hypothetical protein [Rhizobium sp. MHM7A]TLX13015.1 hypothetical protein FFR93_14120 [Rhizobium sp. MHM7A]
MSALRKMSVRRILLAVLCAMPYAEYASASSLEDALREAPMGEPVMIGPLLGPDVEAVCVLQPYQDQLSTRDDVAERLNAQLRAQALAVDEGHFIFAIVRNHTLQLDRIKRSSRLDVFGVRPLPTGTSLPDKFAQAECSPAHTAAIVKFIYRERAYVVFGAVPR